MKILSILATLALCGCQAPIDPTLLPGAQKNPPVPVPSPTAAVAPLPEPTRSPDAPSRKQSQWIEALINQNEALTARLASAPPAPMPSQIVSVAPVVAASSPKAAESPAPSAMPPDSALMPNAEGIIDLVALTAAAAGDEPVNPFAVRSIPGEKSREVSFVVGGTVLGAAPCAVINERLVQTGETFEGFTIERIQPAYVIARFGPHRLRLPVSTQPVRVKLPL